MPSKVKKHLKMTPTLDHSPTTLLGKPSVNKQPDDNEVGVLLQEASGRYPLMIGHSAFSGRISEVDSGARGSKVWLSETTMVAYSFSPGTIVSVSVAATGSKYSDGFPLCSLTDKWEMDFDLSPSVEKSDCVGNYFALATVFPSRKVSRNEVKLSLNLSYTLGCPDHSLIVFVYPINFLPLVEYSKGGQKQSDSISNGLSSFKAKELRLQLTPFKDCRYSATESMCHKIGASSGVSCFSPLKQLSPSSTNLVSSGMKETRSSSLESLKVEEVLKDTRSKQLLQLCATSWLHSRHLLLGNLVAVPILANVYLFRVVAADNLLICGITQDIKHSAGSMSNSLEITTRTNTHAIWVDQDTQIHLCLPLDSPCSIEKDLSNREDKFEPRKTTFQRTNLILGGLKKEYDTLKGIISFSTKNSLSSFGFRATKGVLLYGPPGTGKTSLVHLCARDAAVNLFTVNGPEIVNQYYGESEQAINRIFDAASQAVPAVIFIDELDSIAPARKNGGEDLCQRLVACLLNLIDGIGRNDGIVVIAATNRPDIIEPALRRHGRLDREIEIGVPSPIQRFDILRTLTNEMEHSLLESQVKFLAMSTHGFVGSDLAALCNEAGLNCLRRYSKLNCKIKCDNIIDHILCDSNENLRTKGPESYGSHSQTLTDSQPSLSSYERSQAYGKTFNFDQNICSEQQKMLKVTFADFENARVKVRPSAMKEVILEVPKVSWEDVGGQSEVKRQLMEAVEWPQKHQDAFMRIGSRPPTGVMMFGPPGCSKTLLARAVASEARLNFLAVKGPELFSKWVGESEKAVRSLFAKARANAPSIIFFDEIDALASIRGNDSDGLSVSDRVMSQLLVELDGLQQRTNVTVIAATNRPDKIDAALLRPGRFDRLLYVGPPSEADREEIFRIHLRKIPCSIDVNIKELALLTVGCTGAVVSSICKTAALAALEENVDASVITMQHLKTAITQVRPSDIQGYDDLSSKFQRLVLSARGSDQQLP